MENPNRMALDLVDEAIDFAAELNVGVRHLENEAAILDFGIVRAGGVEAGLLLAEVTTGGLATVRTRLGSVDGAALTHVELSTDHPTAALLACQSTAWPLEIDGEPATGRGPALLSRVGEFRAGELGLDEADFAVLALESTRLPDESLVETVASEADTPTSGVFVLVAPEGSVAGSVAAASRAAERAVSRYVELGGDAAAVRTVTASAPVAPLAEEQPEARERSATAVGLGGRAHVVVDADLDRPEALVHDGGAVGSIDELPAPAQVTLDVAGGPTHVLGEVDEARLGDWLGL